MAKRQTNAPEPQPEPEPAVPTTSWGTPLDPVDGWPIYRDGMSRHRWFAANRAELRRQRLEAALADPDAPASTTDSATADGTTPPNQGA